MAEGELDSLESIATDNKATSLEEKMKSWEASEEEIKAATLGGVVPGGGNAAERTDAFDVGLYIAFPIMVVSCLAVSDVLLYERCARFFSPYAYSGNVRVPH